MSSIPPDLNKNGWGNAQGQPGMYGGNDQYGQRFYPPMHQYPPMMGGYEHHAPAPGNYPGHPGGYYYPHQQILHQNPAAPVPRFNEQQEVELNRKAMELEYGMNPSPYAKEYHHVEPHRFMNNQVPPNVQGMHQSFAPPAEMALPPPPPLPAPLAPAPPPPPPPPPAAEPTPVIIQTPIPDMKSCEQEVNKIAPEPEALFLPPPTSAASEELANSTTSDSESLSTEFNSPVSKSVVEIVEEALKEEAPKEEKALEEPLKVVVEEPTPLKLVECSYSEVFSTSFIPPPVSPVVVPKIEESIKTEEDDGDNRAEQFWNDPTLERIAPQKPEKVKRKYTRRVPKDDSKPVARGRKRKEKPDSDLASTVPTPRKRKLARELSGSPSIQDIEHVKDEPSTSSFSAGSFNYRVSVDVNMETSASEQNSPNIASDDGEPKKRRNRKRRDSQLTMTYRRRKNAKKEGKAPSKTSINKLEREKRMMEKSQVAMEIQKSKFRAASLQFKFEADLEYALSASSNRFPIESIERIKKHLFGKKVSRKNPHYLRTEISFDAVFPDQDDYRHCTAYRQEATIGCTMPLSTRRSGGKTPPSAPPLTLFGTLYTDLNTTAHDVQEHAMNWFKMHRNDIFKKSDVFGGPEPDENLAELERRFYKEVYGDTSLDQFTGVERNRIQTPVIKVETQADLENKNLERILNTASITVVSGICKAAGIDMSLFELNVLTEIDEKLMIDCLYQNPQSANNNFDKEGEKTWRTSGVRIQKKLQWFADYMQGRYNQADKYLEKMANSSNLDETEEKILKEIVKEQEEFPEDADVSMYWSIFGTNIDLQDRAMFPEQHVHLDKLPAFLRPRFEGNLLNLIGEDVLGINTVQVYVKPPGARTAAHMENALMASININLGPGVCVWFAVPYEYWGRLAAIIKSKGLTYHGQDYWPDEEELRANGIPVQKFEQNPDELVYVNTGCFHWVQSSGYCVNVSWNVGQPTATQLSTSMIATTHNVLSRYQDHVPVMGIAWRIAKEKLFMNDEEMYKVVRSILIRTLAHTTWYEDELRVTGKKIIPREQLEFPIPAVVRCIQCGAEVFNVVKWFLGNKDIPSTFFCNRCHPKSEHTEGRYEAYTVLTPRAELMKVMDGYKKRSFEDTPSTSTSEVIAMDSD